MKSPLVLFLVTVLLGGCSKEPPNKYSQVVLDQYEVTELYQESNVISGYLVDGTRFVAVVSDRTIIDWTVYDRPSKVDYAEACQWADVGTTLVGIAVLGATEGNPLGLAILPIKYGTNYYVESLPRDQCIEYKKYIGASGCFGAGFNVVTLGVGSVGPSSLLGGLTGGLMGYSVADSTGCEGWIGSKVKLTQRIDKDGNH